MNIETKELNINDTLKRKIEIICRFSNVKYELINGSIISINNTNLGYIKLHILRINNTDYLFFNDKDIIFINGYNRQIKLCDLESYIKDNN